MNLACLGSFWFVLWVLWRNFMFSAFFGFSKFFLFCMCLLLAFSLQLRRFGVKFMFYGLHFIFELRILKVLWLAELLLLLMMFLFDVAVCIIILVILSCRLGIYGVGLGLTLGFFLMAFLIGIQTKIFKKLMKT